jgi:hypothetical protein
MCVLNLLFKTCKTLSKEKGTKIKGERERDFSPWSNVFGFMAQAIVNFGNAHTCSPS